MQYKNQKNCLCSGYRASLARSRFSKIGSVEKLASRKALTILEIIIALVIITIIFAAVLPQFRVILTGWDSRQAKTEVVQNGRVLIDHINRNLSKAVKITAVSDLNQTNGFIVFQDNDSNNWRYDINATSSYVEFGLVGYLSDLAGPVNSFTFICYDACDLDAPLDIATADVNDIRFINVQATLPNPSALGQDKTFTTSAYLRTNDEISECDPNLVARWKLDETSGLNADDSSGNGNDGTLRNMVGNEWISDGAVGGALNFDGSNDYIAIQNLYYEGSGYPEVTVAAWIRTNDGSDQIIASFDRNEYWRLEINGNGGGTGQIGWDVRTSTGQVDYGSTTTIDDGQWHHVAGVFDNGTLTIYIDGNPETPASGGSTFGRGNVRYGFLGVGSEATYFDGSRGPNNYFNGDMDDVRIYDRALDANEIAQLAETLKYVDFNEAKVGSDDTSITISTPDTNEGDLLIAAVATDGDTSTSLAPVGGGWVGVVNDYSSQVTLGAWYKLADASEPSSHQFTWSAGNPQQAYGWIMHFTGHDPANPINAYSIYGQSSSTPTSPAVTTTVNNCLILRIGAFDNDDVNTLPEPGNPGLSGHNAITMDESASSGGQVTYEEFNDTSANGTSINVPKPAGTIQGDLLVAVVVTDGSTTISSPTGWTPIDRGNSSNQVTLGVWYTQAGASEPASYTFTWTGGNERAYGWIMRFTGHNPANPINAWGSQWGNFSLTPPCPAVNTTVDNTLIIRIGGFDRNYILGVGNPGLPSDHTAINMDQSGGGNNSCSGGAGYKQQTTAGDSGVSNFTLTWFEDYRTVTIAIAPAVATGTVSGGAGYVKQSSSGDSGTANFTLTSANGAQMLTVAIAPADNSGDDCVGSIYP
jgi:type II secretory pathway pseudopilin PulG